MKNQSNNQNQTYPVENLKAVLFMSLIPGIYVIGKLATVAL